MNSKKTTSIKKEALRKLVNPHKLDILETLAKKDKINQADLAKEIKLSERQTRRYITNLKSMGLVKTKKEKKKKGRPRFVSLR